MSQWLPWIGLAQVVVMALGGWAHWSMRRAFVPREDFEKALARLSNSIETVADAVEQRVSRKELGDHMRREEGEITGIHREVSAIREAQAEAVTRGDLIRVHERLDEVQKAASKLEGATDTLSSIVGLINRHLIEAGK